MTSTNRATKATRTRILKFGGTSLATPELIRAAAQQIAAIRATGQPVAVVVSAMGHATDALVALAGNVAGHRPTPRELDVLLATGEQAAAALMAMALRTLAIDAASVVGARIGILADSRHGHASIRQVQATEVIDALARGAVPVIAGFQAVDAHGDLVTLGRGGSDTTAVAIAAAIRDAEAPDEPGSCEILTDVAAIHTADPRAFPSSTPIESISAKSMLQLARAGAQVMHSPAVALAIAANVEITVREAHPASPGHLGTRIVPGLHEEPSPIAVGVMPDLHRLRLDDHEHPMPIIESVARDLARQGLAVTIDPTGPGLVLASSDASNAAEAIRSMALQATIVIERDWSLVSLVGLPRDESRRRGFPEPHGWWDGTPSTAWWLIRSPETVGFATGLVELVSTPPVTPGNPTQRNGDYETFDCGEGACREPDRAAGATMSP